MFRNHFSRGFFDHHPLLEKALKILLRIMSGIAILISALVILFSIGGILGVWMLQDSLTSVGTQTLDYLDGTAQVMRSGIARAGEDISTLEAAAKDVGTASDNISQNVEEQGMLLTLISETKESELRAAAHTLRENFVLIKKMLTAVHELLRLADNLPFVHLPDLSAASTVQHKIDQTGSRVNQLTDNIRLFRTRTSTSISEITAAAAVLNDHLDSIQAELYKIDIELNLLQEQIKHLQKRFKTILISGSITATFLAGWIGYTQIVVIKQMTRYFRSSQDDQRPTRPDSGQ